MITRKGIIIALLLSAFLFVGSNQVAAADQNIKLPPSMVTELNFTNMTFTVDVKGTNVILRITSQTRFFKDGVYAISKDLKQGEMVRGVMKPMADGHPQAVQIFWGRKSGREK